MHHTYHGTNVLQLEFIEVVEAEHRLHWFDETTVGEEMET